jgi:hypothetical protein
MTGPRSTGVRPAMSEDEVLGGLLDAFALAGWRYWHVRRSDRALWMGVRGWPDVTALPPRLGGPLLVLEVKGPRGVLSEAQAVWIALLHRAGVTTGVIRPSGYDRALALIIAGDASPASWEWAFLSTPRA